MGVSIGQIIASNYIKYNRLNDIVNMAFVGSSATKINLFIDINSCIKPMYSSGFSLVNIEERTSIAAHFINMISHYRKFFRSRYKVECSVYFVYSSNVNSNNQIFYPGYNIKMVDTIRLQRDKIDLLMYNLDILDKICPYLPDTSLTVGTFETGVIMNDIMNIIREENVPNIVISKDIYNTQLVAINNDVLMFRPKKSQQDESYFIAKGGCISNLLADRQITQSVETELNDELLSFIMALNKLPERGVKTLLSLPKALSVTREIIRSGKVLNRYNSNISYMYDIFPDKEKAQVIHGGIDGRFKAIDILYQYAIYSNSLERHNFKKIQNLFDPNGLHKICNEYFKVNPLDLENL